MIDLAAKEHTIIFFIVLYCMQLLRSGNVLLVIFIRFLFVVFAVEKQYRLVKRVRRALSLYENNILKFRIE